MTAGITLLFLREIYAVLVSVDQTDDIGTVLVESQQRKRRHENIHFHHMALIHSVRAALSPQDHSEERRHIGAQGPQGYIVGQEKHGEKHHRSHKEDLPVKNKDKSHRRSESFPAAEVQVSREIMSQDASRRSVHGKKRHNVPAALSENEIRQQDRDHAFQDVSQKSQRSRLFAEGSQRVGRSRVSASMFPDIGFMHSADNIGSLKQAAYISDDQTDNSFHNHFSPR